MFRKVKSKFMLISMIAITFVILLIAGCTNIVNYIQSTNSNDEIIQYIMNNKLDRAFPPSGTGTSPIEYNDFEYSNQDAFSSVTESSAAESEDSTQSESQENPPFVPVDFGDRFGQESSYDIRYFTVGKRDNTYFYDLSSISSITQDEAKEYADKAYESNSKTGYIGKYRYNKNSKDDFAVFLLCEKDLNAVSDFMVWSIVFSGIGLLVSFLFIFIFSGKILKPVKDSYEKQKEFVSNASHEMKTPLTVISTNNELLELTQGPNKYTETISKQISKMTTMTKSLTTLARLGENPDLEMEEVNVSELMYQIVDTFTPLFENNGTKLKANIANDIILKTNTGFLSQLVSIILDNACKYTLHEAELVLSADKGIVTILERNDVESIKDGDLSYFTERFYRDDGMRSKVAGSGIGLSIASEITTALHGRMKIYGKDNCFHIQIEMK